ncbi:hypothetical protein QFC19_002226 [Naganishia cerealis]|uniref:Uncharacterized protein n=1 Tax=Naganishia cerealis TaxID=610337 RepID=A0ACC2WDJ0_9TREE|nr:hypothetical protein QFC19_002226 [Naganishia cerealis]
MSLSQTVRKRTFEPEQQGQKRQKIANIDAAVLHCIPPNIVPLVQPPFHESNFFTDLEPRDNPKFVQQVTNIVAKYPPPPPPPLPDQTLLTSGGIMVPFIFPPPPVLKNESVTDSSPKRRLRGSDHDNKTYVELPPLPFPPPNYMPYPMLSDRSTLAPLEVVQSFLDALQNLPRTNMVVASAAGSLLDMKHQAEQEGLTIEDFENGATYDAENVDTEEAEEYMAFAAGVDTSETVDYYDQKKSPPSTVEVNSDMYSRLANVAPRLSSIGRTKSNLLTEPTTTNIDIFQPSHNHEPHPTPSISHPSKDIVTANGVNKERRREDLLRSANQLRSFETRHRRQVYEHKRLQLLLRLESLRSSKILLTDESLIVNDDLRAIQRELEFQRDFEIFRLKVGQNYHLSNNVQFYYENCDRAYKRYNSNVVNKLKKLENFFQYQYDLFNQLLNNASNDVFDIKTRDSGKLYHGISQRNFSAEIKQRETPAVKPAPLVHDFMPMTSLAEFDIITGDGPSKIKQSNLSSKEAKNANLHHTIFQNALYDPATSNSDTNYSELSTSLPSTPKRRGRRAATNLGADKLELFDKQSKHSEAALIARIMKNFVGPQGSKPDELTTDLDQMGITTRWPI